MSAQIAEIARKRGRPVMSRVEALQVIEDENSSLISMREPYLGWVIKTEKMYFDIIDKRPGMEFVQVENDAFPFSIT